MDDGDALPTAERRSLCYARRERAAWGAGILVSVLLHALLFLLWPGGPVPAEGTPTADALRFSASDDPVRVIDVREPARREIEVPKRPLLALEMPEIGADELVRSSPEPAWTPAVRPPSPPGFGPRLPATIEEGDGYVRPIALSILPDWKPPRSLHGVEIIVRVHTSAAGRATGLVELVPPTPDAAWNRQIVSRVRGLEYRPAVRNGQPVAAWAEITFVFCSGGVTATSPASPTGLADPCSGEKGREAGGA